MYRNPGIREAMARKTSRSATEEEEIPKLGKKSYPFF